MPSCGSEIQIKLLSAVLLPGLCRKGRSFERKSYGSCMGEPRDGTKNCVGSSCEWRYQETLATNGEIYRSALATSAGALRGFTFDHGRLPTFTQRMPLGALPHSESVCSRMSHGAYGTATVGSCLKRPLIIFHLQLLITVL